ncbi:23S rRNA pseudouridine1911/1915/1917 synthase [Acetitomaculum ruminis DSM 5522]|uniref:Pseudouridine synthase n=1 Tax=Acetitomaculum ruminis DSM 5522 TaxID=1120918 RepID=A0A1I0V666_9FIRM|nr:RluA family pseudouridine synthase [Acetitomaculum ruminis]SFA71742.1 23S rRNA pseudouridine1911/1915/1917 synthase [Acetitomaculum ruminis DSM 5522]
MNIYDYVVSDEMDGERLDVYLSLLLEDKSRSYIQKLIKSGNVSVIRSDKPILKIKNSCILSENDKVQVEVPDITMPTIEAENIDLDIIYEDDDILIVNKPKEMVVHPAAGHYTHTLVNGLLYHCKNLSGINGVMRPGIVHRIDMNTTGALIVCKNDYSHKFIAEQLAKHSITRKYEGIVHGVFDNEAGTVEGAIGRDKNDRKKMAIDLKNGKPAITHYKVIKNYKNHAHLEFQLETGRTHQIRVHMKSINHPLLGDDIYGSGKSKIKNLKGQCLHARIIGFIHPTTGKYVEFEAPLPKYFIDILEKSSL